MANDEKNYTSAFKGTAEDLLDDIINNSRIGYEKNLAIVDKETGEEVFRLERGKQLSFDFSKDEITTAELSAVYTPEDERTTPRWIWSDPVIFDDESKRAFMEMTPEQRVRFTADLMAKFYAERPEYAHFSRFLIYEQPIELLTLFKSLTLDDFKACEIANADTRFKLLQDNIKATEKTIKKRPVDIDKLATIWPILSLREMFMESELASLYYLKRPRAAGAELAEILEEAPAIYNLPFGNYLFATAEIMSHIAAQRDLYYEVTKSGRKKSDRHKQITVKPIQNGFEVTQSKKGESTTITVLNKDLIKSTAAMKLFIFLLAKANQQNLNPIITFSLQELVNIGMYSKIDNARQGFKNQMAAVQSLQIAGEMKKGKRYVIQEGAVLFHSYRIDSNIVKVWCSELINEEFLTSYYTKLPSWAWSLSDNAFELLLYIFMKARTERKAAFNISFSIIREKLALPTKEEYAEKGKKFKAAQYVKDPIKAAINNIIDVAKMHQDENIVIDPHYILNDRNLDEWLNGFIAVKISGEYAEVLKSIKDKRTKIIEANTRRREEARAAAEAKKEAEKG